MLAIIIIVDNYTCGNMKTLVCSIIAVFLQIGVCFSQPEVEMDPCTGIQMKLDLDKSFLEVTHFGIGTPADISGVKVGDKIFKIQGQAVSELPDPTGFMKNVTDSWLKLGIHRIGNAELLEMDVPRVSIDLNSDQYRTEGYMFKSIDLRQKVSVTPDNYDLEKKKSEVTEIVNSTPNPAMYEVYDVFGGVGCDYRINADSKRDAIITMLSDDMRDMTKYLTFDFDFISTDDPLMEKKLASILEAQLISLGLKRSQDNPDLLIILSFYSGQKDQYVPPQQIISTKIKSVFNWYWGYIPVPVTESKTQGGYTQMTYLSNINLKILDAKEIETSKTPPLVWSGSISQVSPEKIFLTDQAYEFFSMTMSQFPIVWQQNADNYAYNHYAYTGVIYDLENPEIIADVIPGSPAAKAGIKKGDKILNINGKTPTFNGIPQLGSWASAFAYIFVFTKFKNGVASLFPNVSGEFSKYKQNGSVIVNFDIKQNGKKTSLGIKPEDKKVIYFDREGTTIN
jgi:hypothetical protein